MESPSTALTAPAPARAALSDPFMPSSMSELKSFGEMIAKSAFAPASYKGKPEDCMIAILYGRELGVSPLQALQGVAVINGRPGVFGDLLWALVCGHPDFEDCREEVVADRASVTLKRKKRTAYTVSFSIDDAKKAGLWGKAGPWTQYPSRMMLWRARTFAARFVFADALKGLTSIEELQDTVIDAPLELASRESLPAPAPTAAAPAAPATIGEEEVKQLTASYRKSGYKSDEVRAKMVELFGESCTRSGLIPKEGFDKILAWASKPKDAPTAAAEAKPADPVPAAQPSRAELACREAFGLLDLDLFGKQKEIDDHTIDGVTDWKKLFERLSSLVDQKAQK